MKSLSYSTCTSVSLSAMRVGSIRVDSSDIANGTEKNTVNVDIFAFIHFCEFANVSNFAWTLIRVFDVIASMWHNTNNIHIFADISETQITQKYVHH